MAMEAAGMGDSQASATERVAWRRRDKRARSDMAKPEHNEPERKLYHSRGFEWLLATDHQMWRCAGKRWADYIQHEQDHLFTQPALEQWGVVTCSIDQGADDWQALQHLMYEMRVAVVAVKDIPPPVEEHMVGPLACSLEALVCIAQQRPQR